MKMKRGALFINTSRGKVVSESGLIEALKAGIVGGAALDVRENEPPQFGDLETLPNVILLPPYRCLHARSAGPRYSGDLRRYCARPRWKAGS